MGIIVRTFVTKNTWVYAYHSYGGKWAWVYEGKNIIYLPRRETAKRILRYRKSGQITGLSTMDLLVGGYSRV